MKTKELNGSDRKKIENSISNILSIMLGQDWKNDPDMKETPKRFQRMYEHFFRNEDPIIHTEKTFPTKNDQLVIVKDMEVFGMCPHHLVPIIYNVHIGYIPNGYAIGLSKLSRISSAVASFPKLQENMTTEIADVLEKSLKPLGIIVVVDGVHGCMRTRGVEQCNSSTVTSDCRGVMREKPEARQEFLSLVS